MITCGIEIEGKQAIFVILQSQDDSIKDITGKFNQLILENDESCREVQSFSQAINAHFDSINPDKIAVIKRNKKGRFSGGAVSFKIEGLIQSYPKKNIELVSLHTLRAYKEKNHPQLKQKFKYQENAYLLALYLMK